MSNKITQKPGSEAATCNSKKSAKNSRGPYFCSNDPINSMTAQELKIRIRLGEDSQHQFKRNIESIDQLTAEICAFANSDGGTILLGIDDSGDVVGLDSEQIHRLNQMISNSTSQKIEPPLFVKTQTLLIDEKAIMLVIVPRGKHKPYASMGAFWVKNGADKRRARREELIRLMQTARFVFADEMPGDVSIDHIDHDYFAEFYFKAYSEGIEETGIEEKTLLNNLKLAEDNHLTLAGLLIFVKNRMLIPPQFTVKATSYYGIDKAGDDFIDKDNIGGTLMEQFKGIQLFVKRNLKKIQTEKGFNSPAELEIPEGTIEELAANAIVHRDYFVNSPIFVDLFSDRLEIVSPGTLPNSVTDENIKYGLHIERNPILLSIMEKIPSFRYSGRGSGIPRVIRQCKEKGLKVTFTNDTDATRFIARVYRPAA